MLYLASIAASNYWPQLLVLASSLAEHAPGHELHVLVLDDDPVETPNLPGLVLRLYRLADLRTELGRLQACFTVTERATAVKPLFLAHLLATQGCETLAYVDPDIMFLDGFGAIQDSLGSCDILLTPHFAALEDAGAIEREILFMQGGAFNLGFIALRRSANVSRFLAWWGERALQYSSEDASRGVFTDQRWVDLVPGIFDRVHIDRHPGHNVAPWNLQGRPILREDGKYRVRGHPLVFFHFSKFRLNHPDLLTFLEGRPHTSATRELVAEYATRLRGFVGNQDPARREIPEQDRLPNGEPIPRLLRAVLRGMGPEAKDFWSPSSVPAAEVMRRLVRSADGGVLVRTATYQEASLHPDPDDSRCLRRYRRSALYRWYIDTWFYLFGPLQLRIPVEWVEPNAWRRRLRSGLGRAYRRLSATLPRRLPG